MSLDIILPDIDIWIRAFGRREVDPQVVHRLGQLVRQRQVAMLPWIRVALLARTRDGRQFARLQSALAGFPDLRLTVVDQIDAARLIQECRGTAVGLGTLQATGWALALRVAGSIWSRDRRWHVLVPHGCPVTTDGGAVV